MSILKTTPSKFSLDEQNVMQDGSMSSWSERSFELADEHRKAQATIAACESELADLLSSRAGDPEKMSAKLAAKRGTAEVLRERLVQIRRDFLAQRVEDLKENLELDQREYEDARGQFKQERAKLGDIIRATLLGDVEPVVVFLTSMGKRVYTAAEEKHLNRMNIASKMDAGDRRELEQVTAELNAL